MDHKLNMSQQHHATTKKEKHHTEVKKQKINLQHWQDRLFILHSTGQTSAGELN